MTSLDLSVIIPALNEREALPGLLEEIAITCDGLGLDWETIVVDDGSTDGTLAAIEEMRREDPRLRAIRLRRNFGKAAALAAGFERAAGAVIVTIDGDGQDDPADIPSLLAELEAGADLVSGWKRNREDPWSRRAASRVFNGVTARLTGVSMHDMNCGFKAYRRDCALSLEVYGELHRYLPVMAAQQGWRVTEVPVNHRARQHGRSRYGLERYLRGALDLLTVVFIGRYQHRPLHLFGGIGFIFTAVGALIAIYLTILKIDGQSIGQRPLLFLAVLLIVVGVQLLTFGLLAQMVVLARRDRLDTAGGMEGQIERLVGFEADLAGSAVSPAARQ
ncbi:MAG: glycosyltransferase family 2 protein [Solirubrobacterales bacterium]